MGCIQATEKTQKTPIRATGAVKDNKIPSEIALAPEQRPKESSRSEQKDQKPSLDETPKKIEKQPAQYETVATSSQQNVKPSEAGDETDKEAFGEVKEDPKEDKREKLRIKRSMSIMINEEGHPLWIKVDEIWEEALLKDSQNLSSADAKAAILAYCREDLGQTHIDKHLEVFEDLWQDIESQNGGNVTRDAMFNHLKYARDVEVPTEVVEATSPGRGPAK